MNDLEKINPVPPMYQQTVEEFAQNREKEGIKVIRTEEIILEEFFKGFFRPISFLKSYPYSVKKVFPKLNLGYHFRLNDSDLKYRNGSIPVHVLSDPSNFDISKLSSKERKRVRRAKKDFELVEIKSIEQLAVDGYRIYKSAMSRTARETDKTESSFINDMTRYFVPGRALILGAKLINEPKICGFMIAFAIEDKGYIDQVYVDSDYTNSNVNRLLLVGMLNSYKQVPDINEITMGQHFREMPGIVKFKDLVGFPVKHLPAYCSINPVAKTIMRKVVPHKYYRLTGSSTE